MTFADLQKFDSQFNEKLALIYKKMSVARRVLLATHENPDGDGLGAMLALYSFLKEKDKEVFCFSPDLPDYSLNFLPYISEVKKEFPQESFELIIGLDYGDLRRLGIPQEVLEKYQFIAIDHHLDSEAPPWALSLVYSDFSSTSEIIFFFFKKNNIPITKEIATLLLCGILVDTGGFSHITTSPRVLEIASELLEKGVSPSGIINRSLYQGDHRSLKVWGLGLNRMKRFIDLGMVFSYILKEDFEEYGVEFDDVAGLISLMNTASDAKFTLLLIEVEKGIIKGSLRSEKFKGVDVSKIAKRLGGGGHKYAAGFTKEGDIDSVLEEVKMFLSQPQNRKTYDIMPPL